MSKSAAVGQSDGALTSPHSPTHRRASEIENSQFFGPQNRLYPYPISPYFSPCGRLQMATAPLLNPSLKRKHAEDSSPNSPINSPSDVKRQKVVSFSPSNEVRYVGNTAEDDPPPPPPPQEAPLSLVLEEVKVAFIQHRQNNNVKYNLLKSKFTLNPEDDDAPSNSDLRKHIIALTAEVLAFNDNSGDMVHSVMKCNWLQRDEGFLDDFRYFLTVLLTTYNGYLPLVLKWLIGKFTGGSYLSA
jgi:RNA polymerase I specific transcription initiation factor RRN3